MKWPGKVGAASLHVVRVQALQALAARGRRADAAAGLVLALAAAGCGNPGSPMPPSLDLPQQVSDLKAVRQGDAVLLSWTMPERDTSKLLLRKKGKGYEARLCRSAGAGPCQPITQMPVVPGQAAEWRDVLLPEMRTGAKDALLTYRLTVHNAAGHAVPEAAVAFAAAGAAPPPVEGLKAQAKRQGVLLTWEPAGEQTAALRLHRESLDTQENQSKDARSKQPAGAKQRQESSLIGGDVQVAAVEDLLVKPSAEHPGMAFDTEPRQQAHYAYSAQRVQTVTLSGHNLELVSERSRTVTVDAGDVSAPVRPGGLNAVLVYGETAGGPVAADLSWTPNSEEDLSGYRVYRRLAGEHSFTLISGGHEIGAPSFTDAHSAKAAEYRVTAVDTAGRESQPSDPVQAR